MGSRKYVLLVLIFVACKLYYSEGNGNSLDHAIKGDFKNFFSTGIAGKLMSNIAKELDLKDLFRTSSTSNTWTEPKINLFCKACAAGVNEILDAKSVDAVYNRTISLCVELGIGTQFICGSLITANEKEILYILGKKPDLNGNDICGVIFVGRGCVSKNPDRDWEVVLPDVRKPEIIELPYQKPGLPTMKVLHLADTHYDPEYLPGSAIKCEEKYLCCRNRNGNRMKNNTAGFWGSYGACDVPKWTLEALYDHISKTHKDLDFIIWTGDIVPHNVWNVSKEVNIAIIQEMADLILQYFPGIPVYPAVGNHEAVPVNQFSQPYITDPDLEMSWLYDELSSIWQNWLPEEIAASVANSAYYSVEVKPGFRIISVNTNYCYGYNWWLILDSTDIGNELDLLAKELQKSEDKGEKVYIIGHIPPGDKDCSLTWSHEFNKIIARYESTVNGMFFGHTHNDHFQLFFDPKDRSRVYEVAYIAQSQTTYANLNPGYKIYTTEGHYDQSEFRVLDHENWIINLNEANAMNKTNVIKLYSAKEEYRLENLGADTLLNMVIKMNVRNSAVFDSFYRNYIKASSPGLYTGCDNTCKSKLLCGLLVSDNSDHSPCNRYLAKRKG